MKQVTSSRSHKYTSYRDEMSNCQFAAWRLSNLEASMSRVQLGMCTRGVLTALQRLQKRVQLIHPTWTNCIPQCDATQQLYGLGNMRHPIQKRRRSLPLEAQDGHCLREKMICMLSKIIIRSRHVSPCCEAATLWTWRHATLEPRVTLYQGC